jgi:hypothetical protein
MDYCATAMRWAAWSAVTLLGAALSACGSEPEDANYWNRDAGASGGAAGASGASGATGTGGTAGSSGTAGTAGVGGSGGGTSGGSGGGTTGGSGGGTVGGSGGGTSGAGGETLSQRYPNDDGLASDPAVLFHDDFEGGWGKWTSPTSDTNYLHLEQDAALAHAGSRFLRSTVTKDDLDAQQYIGAMTRFDFPTRVDTVYWRFHARFKGIAPNPHHWVRMAAGTQDWSSSGLANTVPPGDQGFWFDLDANNADVFNFYAYWYNMRSGRCNDGTAVPGCEGDQGTTYYYGNTFRPPEQTPFVRDAWFCIEVMAKANTVGQNDGELAFWINDQVVGEYREGYPNGTWLRDQFHTDGCTYSACTDPVPFEGFDFRSSDDVRFKQIFLDAYYERGTFESKKAALEALGLTVSDEQTIYYDDVVVATERIGCRAP